MKENIEKGAALGYTNATDVADYLALKGLTLRMLTKLLEKLFLFCIRKTLPLTIYPIEIKENSLLFGRRYI